MGKNNIEIGKPAPNFTLPTDGGGSFTLSENTGKKIILFFYPKDNTPGCTLEACGFRNAMPNFSKLNVSVIGISKCSLKKHENFKKKYALTFPLASDQHSDVCERYGVWTEKNMFGHKYMGIERTTVLIDEHGIIRAIWSKVKILGHVEEVQAEITKLAKTA